MSPRAMPSPADPGLAGLVADSEAHRPVVSARSRYAGVGTAIHVGPDGSEIPYLRRRFVPPPESLSLLGEHRVRDGERLDVISARHLGDPTRFWQLCDANRAMRPAELEVPDRPLRVTLPEGMPGGRDG